MGSRKEVGETLRWEGERREGMDKVDMKGSREGLTEMGRKEGRELQRWRGKEKGGRNGRGGKEQGKVGGAKEGMFTVGREVGETGGWVKSGKEGRKGRND